MDEQKPKSSFKIVVALAVVIILIIAGALFAFTQSGKNKDYAYNPTNSIATTTGTSKTFTLVEVAKHNTDSSCYTVVNGSVYDVTSWISQHPGGKQAIIGMCGVDASSAFNGQHGGQARPESELASFKIGALIK